jgi:hypothetical protein
MTLSALFRTASLALGAALLAACTSNPTKLAETWIAPGVTKIDAQRIVVVAFAPSEASRMRMETEITSRMKKTATPSNLVLTGEELKDPAKAVAKIKAAGFDTAVVMRLVDQQTYALAVPQPMPQYMSTSPYYQQTKSAYATNYVIETVVFSVIEGKPLVRVTTETFQTPDPAVLADRLFQTVVAELNARGLL